MNTAQTVKPTRKSLKVWPFFIWDVAEKIRHTFMSNRLNYPSKTFYWCLQLIQNFASGKPTSREKTGITWGQLLSDCSDFQYISELIFKFLCLHTLYGALNGLGPLYITNCTPTQSHDDRLHTSHSLFRLGKLEMQLSSNIPSERQTPFRQALRRQISCPFETTFKAHTYVHSFSIQCEDIHLFHFTGQH